MIYYEKTFYFSEGSGDRDPVVLSVAVGGGASGYKGQHPAALSLESNGLCLAPAAGGDRPAQPEQSCPGYPVEGIDHRRQRRRAERRSALPQSGAHSSQRRSDPEPERIGYQPVVRLQYAYLFGHFQTD